MRAEPSNPPSPPSALIPHPSRAKEGLPIRGAFAGFCSLLMIAECGCRSHSRTDVLEAELRARDRKIRELEAHLDHAHTINEALEHEFLAAPLPHPPSVAGRPGSPLLIGSLDRIEIARGTGGVDDDGFPGDESLLVVVVPRDRDGSEIKAPGSLLITAYEVTEQGIKLPLSSWQVSSLQLRKRWKRGLFSTGYFVPLDWQTPPTSDRLRIVVQMTLLSGEVYEGDRDVKIRPMPGPALPPMVQPGDHYGPPILPETAGGPPGTVEPPSEPLPMPRLHSASYGVRLLPPRTPGGE